METIERDDAAIQRNRIAITIFGSLAILAAVVLYFGLRPPPQMGASEETFKTVDALYTAIRNEDEARLADCEARLLSANEAGKLPDPAWKTLNAIIAKARSGKWRPAAESLYEFIRGQKRESASEPEQATPKKRK
jgi:hypothetical protein